MMNTNFILNEKEYVLKSLNDGTYTAGLRKTLDLLAQYYYQYCGFRKVKITKLLLEFLEKNYPPYAKNTRQWEATCEKIARHTGGKNLLEIDGVTITENELNVIKNIQNKTNARLAFTMLCIAKLNDAKNPKNNGWLNLDSKTIFECARVSGTRKQRDLRIADMLDSHLIEIPQRTNKVNIRVAFMDETTTENQGMFVSDFRELGLQYRKNVLKENIGICKNCGKYFTYKEACAMEKASRICPDCIIEKNKPKPRAMREGSCCVCGKSFTVIATNNSKVRCDDCQAEFARERDRKRKQFSHSGEKNIDPQ